MTTMTVEAITMKQQKEMEYREFITSEYYRLELPGSNFWRTYHKILKLKQQSISRRDLYKLSGNNMNSAEIDALTTKLKDVGITVYAKLVKGELCE